MVFPSPKPVGEKASHSQAFLMLEDLEIPVKSRNLTLLLNFNVHSKSSERITSTWKYFQSTSTWIYFQSMSVLEMHT